MMDDQRPQAPTTRPRAASSRQCRGRARRLANAAAAAVAATVMVATIAATAPPAGASTVDGIATIAQPGTTTPLLSGASTDPFTVALPSGASCDGDTASGGYHVYSYLLPAGTALSSVTFVSHPSAGLGFFNPSGTYFGPVNTAIGTGEIPSLPNNFEWAPIIANNYIPLTGAGGLLYTGSGTTASGVWEAGIVCANSSGAPVDNWNTEVTFSANATDTNGFVWSAVPGPSGSSPAVFTSADSATFTEGAAGSFTPVASGSPTPVITESGTLPTGVRSPAVPSPDPDRDGQLPDRALRRPTGSNLRPPRTSP